MYYFSNIIFSKKMNTDTYFSLPHSEAHFSSKFSANIPFMHSLQLSVIFQENNTWNCLLILCVDTPGFGTKVERSFLVLIFLMLNSLAGI